MGRWLSKTERDKRDAKILELYDMGIPVVQIAAQFAWTPPQMHDRIRRLKKLRGTA